MAISFVGQPGIYDRDRDIVRFLLVNGDKTVPCWVSHEALEGLTQSRGLDGPACLQAFEANRPKIEAMAAQKYMAGGINREGRVGITTADLNQ